MVFNSGDFKIGISFSFRIPSDPAKGAWGGLGPIKRSCDISILGLLIVGILKVRQVFLLGYPQTLPRLFLGDGGGGGWDLYTTKDNELDQF